MKPAFQSPPRPRAILFDLDGTLVDSRIDFTRMKARIIRRFEEEGVPSHLLSMENTVAGNMEVARDYLCGMGEVDLLSRLEIGIERDLASIELQALDSIRAVGRAPEVLLWLKEAGIGIGVLTRGSRKYASEALRRTYMDHLVQGMVCRDDFPWWEAKPNGISLQRLADKLGADPRQTWLVGDHQMDLECANSTGAVFVGVLSGHQDLERWARAGLEWVIDSIDDIPRLVRAGE